MRNADMPAMPTMIKAGEVEQSEGGLTKREYIAALAMQGLLASDADGTLAMDTNVRLSVEHADALLAELERTQ